MTGSKQGTTGFFCEREIVWAGVWTDATCGYSNMQCVCVCGCEHSNLQIAASTELLRQDQGVVNGHVRKMDG